MHDYLDHFEDSPSVFFKWLNEPNWPVAYVTKGVKSIFGYDKEEFLNHTITYRQLIHPDDLERVGTEVIAAINSHQLTYEHRPYRILTKDKQIRWIQDTTKIERDEEGNVIAFFGFVTDITQLKTSYLKLAKNFSELKKKGHESHEYRKALDASYIVSMSDLEGRITYVNDNLTKISEYSAEELIGRPHSILRHPSVPKSAYQELWETIQSNRIWQGMLRNKTKSGKSYFVKMTIVPILDEKGNIEQYMAVRYDMTDYVRQHEQLRKAALSSVLSGLPNLYALLRDIDSTTRPTLALVNVDGFKMFNNLFGYAMGDTIIRKIGELLSAALLPCGYRIYHIHADEFAVLGESEPYDDFMETMRVVQQQLHAKGFEAEGKTFPLHCSIAVSNEAKEKLMVTCNMAMHYARNAHEDFVEYGESLDMRDNYHNNLQWSTIIHEAIQNRLITPFFQPIYDIATKRVYKFESLMRIVRDGEVFAPSLFLEISKKANLYSAISIMMLERVFDVIIQEPFDISINITMEDIRNPRYLRRLFELLTLPRNGGVILEIVESEGIESFEEMNDFIERTKSLGCKIAIDDFGTGYSNFAYLLKLNADFIKIDGSLIQNIDTDRDAEDIVRTIVSFAKKKNIKVIAEFVGNNRVLCKTKEIGIDFAQGFFIGKPESRCICDRAIDFSCSAPSSADMIRLVYVSQPDKSVDYSVIQELLTLSHRRNRERNLTGAVVFDGQYFIQCLEGDAETVNALFAKIKQDSRHHSISVIDHSQIIHRQFTEWQMSYMGHFVYNYVISTFCQDVAYDPYMMEREELLSLLQNIIRIA
ncbi:MAG: EAL domain-containing protein [Sulfuricurvum sp.]